jgi:hypothetical protein
MASSFSTSFHMTCPECDDDIDDIEATVYVGSRSEEFWGASVRVDESECEIGSVPDCPTCKKQTISEDAASEHYWDRVHG